MAEHVRKWRKGDPITHGRLNAYNDALSKAKKTSVSAPLGALRNGSGESIVPGYQEKVILFELKESPAIYDEGESGDSGDSGDSGSAGVYSALCHRVVYDPVTDDYGTEGDGDGIYRVYFPMHTDSSPPDISSGFRTCAKFNYQSGRWEGVCTLSSTGVYKGKLDEDMNSLSTATVSIYNDAGTVDTGIDAEVTDESIPSGMKLEMGGWLWVKKGSDGVYRTVSALSCPVNQ